MATTLTITLKTPEEVIEELQTKRPDIAGSCSIEIKGTPKPWVWMKTPAAYARDEDAKRVIKEVGFKWAKKKQLWFHTCETDPTKLGRNRFKGNRPKGGAAKPSAPQPSSPLPAQRKPKARYQPTTNVSDEFKKRFNLQ